MGRPRRERRASRGTGERGGAAADGAGRVGGPGRCGGRPHSSSGINASSRSSGSSSNDRDGGATAGDGGGLLVGSYFFVRGGDGVA